MRGNQAGRGRGENFGFPATGGVMPPLIGSYGGAFEMMPGIGVGSYGVAGGMPMGTLPVMGGLGIAPVPAGLPPVGAGIVGTIAQPAVAPAALTLPGLAGGNMRTGALPGALPAGLPVAALTSAGGSFGGYGDAAFSPCGPMALSSGVIGPPGAGADAITAGVIGQSVGPIGGAPPAPPADATQGNKQ